MPKYADETRTTIESSRREIEQALKRYGADEFAYAWSGDPPADIIAFRLDGHRVKFRVPWPDPASEEIMLTATRKTRPASARPAAIEQAKRQRWRALVLFVKAALEAIDMGLMGVGDAFLANTVLPGGRTVGEWAEPQIRAAIREGRVPPLLTGG